MDKVNAVVKAIKTANGAVSTAKKVLITGAVVGVGVAVKHELDIIEHEEVIKTVRDDYSHTNENIDKFNAYVRIGGQNKRQNETNIYNNQELEERNWQNSAIRSNRKRLDMLKKDKAKLEAVLKEMPEHYQEHFAVAGEDVAIKTTDKTGNEVSDSFVDVEHKIGTDYTKTGANVIDFNYLKDFTPSYTISSTRGLFNMHWGLKDKIKNYNKEILDNVVDSPVIKVAVEDDVKEAEKQAQPVNQEANKEANKEEEKFDKDGHKITVINEIEKENLKQVYDGNMDEKELAKIFEKEQGELDEALKNNKKVFDNTKFQIEKDSLEYNILVGGMGAVEVSHEIKNRITNGHWIKRHLRIGNWGWTSAAKAVINHNKIKNRVKRNQALYQKVSLKAYQEMYSSLVNENLDGDTEAVIKKYQSIMFRDVKSGKKQTVLAGKTYTGHEENAWLHFNPQSITLKKLKTKKNNQFDPLVNYQAASAIYNLLKTAMANDDSTNICKAIDMYGESFSGNLFINNMPMCHKFFLTASQRRAMKLRPDLAKVLLMQCVTQKMFDSVNRYTDGNVDIEAFGQLAANYQVSKLAATAIMNRQDFLDGISTANHQEREANKRRLQGGISVMKDRLSDDLKAAYFEKHPGEKEIPKDEQAKYDQWVQSLDHLASFEATKNPMTNELREYLMTYGAILGITHETENATAIFKEKAADKEHKAATDELYNTYLKEIVESFPSREQAILDYAKNKLAQNKDLPNVESVQKEICDEVKRNIKQDFLFAPFWTDLLKAKQQNGGQQEGNLQAEHMDQIQENEQKQVVAENMNKAKNYNDLLKNFDKYYKDSSKLQEQLQNYTKNRNALQDRINAFLLEKGLANSHFVASADMVQQICSNEKTVRLFLKGSKEEIEAEIQGKIDTLSENLGAIDSVFEKKKDSYILAKNGVRDNILRRLGNNILLAGKDHCQQIAVWKVTESLRSAKKSEMKEERTICAALKNVNPKLKEGVLGRLAKECKKDPKFLSGKNEQALQEEFSNWQKDYLSNIASVLTLYENKYFDSTQAVLELKFVTSEAWASKKDFEDAVKTHFHNLEENKLVSKEKKEGMYGANELKDSLNKDGVLDIKLATNSDCFGEDILTDPELAELFEDGLSARFIIEASKKNPDMAEILKDLKTREDLNHLNAAQYKQFSEFLHSRLTALASAYRELSDEQKDYRLKVNCMKEVLAKSSTAVWSMDDLMKEQLERNKVAKVATQERQYLRFAELLTKSDGKITFDQFGHGTTEEAQKHLSTRLHKIQTADNFWKLMEHHHNSDAGLTRTMLSLLSFANEEVSYKKTVKGAFSSKVEDRTAKFNTKQLMQNFIKMMYNKGLGQDGKALPIDDGFEEVWKQTKNSPIIKPGDEQNIINRIKEFIGSNQPQAEKKSKKDKNSQPSPIQELIDASLELSLMGKSGEILSLGKPGYAIFGANDEYYEMGLSDLMKLNFSTRHMILTSATDENGLINSDKMKDLAPFVGDMYTTNAEKVDVEWPKFVSDLGYLNLANTFLKNKFQELQTNVEQALKDTSKKKKNSAVSQLKPDELYTAQKVLEGIIKTIVGIDKLIANEIQDFAVDEKSIFQQDKKQKPKDYNTIFNTIVKNEAIIYTAITKEDNAALIKKLDPNFTLGEGALTSIRIYSGVIDENNAEFRMGHEAKNLNKQLEIYLEKKADLKESMNNEQAGTNPAEILANLQASRTTEMDQSAKVVKNYTLNLFQLKKAEEAFPDGQRLTNIMMLLEKDDSFIQLMSEAPSVELDAYIAKLHTQYQSLLDFLTNDQTGEYRQDKDLVQSYLYYDMDRLLNQKKPMTTKQITQRYDNYVFHLGMIQDSSGKSLQKLLAKSNEKILNSERGKLRKDQVNLAVLTALYGSGLYTLQELATNASHTEDLIKLHKGYHDSNMAYLQEKGYVAKLKNIKTPGSKNADAYTMFQAMYDGKLYLLVPSDFQAAVDEMVQKSIETTVTNEVTSLTKAQRKQEERKNLKEEAIKYQYEEELKKSKDAFTKDEDTIAEQRRLYYSGVSPVEYAYRKQGAKPYTQKQFTALCEKMEKELRDHKEFATAEIPDQDIKLLAEIYRGGDLWRDHWFATGNTVQCYQQIKGLRATATNEFYKMIKERGLSNLLETDPKCQDKVQLGSMIQQEIDRFIYYEAAQQRLHFTDQTYYDNFFGSLCQNLIEWFVSWTGKTYDRAKKEGAKAGMEQYDGYRVAQQGLDSMIDTLLKIQDPELHDLSHAELEGLQMAMFTLPAKDYVKLVSDRKNYYFMADYVKTTTKQVAKEQLKATVKDEKNLEEYANRIGNNMLKLLGKDMKDLIPDNLDEKKVDTEAREAAAKAALKQKIEAHLCDKQDGEQWLKLMNAEATRQAISNATIEEDHKNMGDLGYNAYVDAISKLGKTYVNKFNQLSIQEQQALALALSMPGRFVSTDGGYSADLITNHMLVRDNGLIIRKEDQAEHRKAENASKIVDILLSDKRRTDINYAGAVYRLTNVGGKNLSRQAFDMALDFVLTAKTEATEAISKNWDVINNPQKSIAAAMEADNPKPQIPETEEVTSTKAFVGEVSAHLKDEKLKKRLDNCKNVELLVTVLQNRSILDVRTKESLDGNKIVNPYMRRKLIQQWVSNEKGMKDTYQNEATKSVFLNKAIETLKSFQVKEDINPNQEFLLPKDLVNVNRKTGLDEKLLGQALDLVDAIQTEFKEGTLANGQDFVAIYSKSQALNGGVHKTKLFDGNAYGLVSDMISARAEKSNTFDIFTTNGEYEEWMRDEETAKVLKQVEENKTELEKLWNANEKVKPAEKLPNEGVVQTGAMEEAIKKDANA